VKSFHPVSKPRSSLTIKIKTVNQSLLHRLFVHKMTAVFVFDSLLDNIVRDKTYSAIIEMQMSSVARTFYRKQRKSEFSVAFKNLPRRPTLSGSEFKTFGAATEKARLAKTVNSSFLLMNSRPRWLLLTIIL